MRLSMSKNPHITIEKKSSRVETSASGGRKNIRMMRDLLAKIMKRPPTAVNAENTPKTIRKGRYGGRDMGATSLRWVGRWTRRLYGSGLTNPQRWQSALRYLP